MPNTPIKDESQVLELADPLPLDGGQSLSGVRIAYETHGTLNAAKDNAVL
ncbi:MAG: homoserine O-acetyltransferase, partial [Novosphingobium sp.]